MINSKPVAVHKNNSLALLLRTWILDLGWKESSCAIRKIISIEIRRFVVQNKALAAASTLDGRNALARYERGSPVTDMSAAAGLLLAIDCSYQPQHRSSHRDF